MHLPCALLLIVCTASAQATIQIHEVPYRSADGTCMVGYFAYNDGRPGVCPRVTVVHKWWGLNDYAKRRARDLAEFGYSTLAVDVYGEGKYTKCPQDAMALMQTATRDADVAKAHFLTSLELLKRQPQTDPSQIAAIGYCFGDKIVPDMARQDLPLADVVSSHGVPGTATSASKDSVKAEILMEHDNADSPVPTKDLDTLKQELSAAGASYRVVAQDGAKYGFTNPDTDAHRGHDLDIGYNRQADRRPQTNLQAFLRDIFGQGRTLCRRVKKRESPEGLPS